MPSTNDITVAPSCKCGQPCEWYGLHGGFSVQCADCNAESNRKKRARAQRKMNEDRTPLQRESDKAWVGRMHRYRAVTTGKVVAWLRLNPYSTSDEIRDGCGHGVGSVNGEAWKFVKRTIDEQGFRRYYVDGELFEKVMSNENI